MTRRRKIWLRIALALVGVLAIAAISGILVLRSAWFHDAVRRRIVREIETATGGRAELGNFAFDWSSMVATVQGLVLHGKEGPTDPPLLRVHTVKVRLHVVPMF